MSPEEPPLTHGPVERHHDAAAVRTSWDAPEVGLIGAFPPPVGGQAVYNRRLLEELAARGICMKAIDVGAGPTSHQRVTRLRLASMLLRNRFSVYHLTASDARIIGLELIVAAASVLRGTPFVYNILAGRFAQRTSSYSRLHRLLLCLALRRAARILVSNREMAESVKGLPLLSGAKVEVVGCRLPVGAMPEDDPELIDFLQGGDPSVVAIGALRLVYGLDVLVRACTLLHRQGVRPRALLLLSGTPERDAEKALDDALREAEGTWPVMIRREVPRARALGAMRAAGVVARPTRADGDSVSIHEARALGVPVVASDAAPRPCGVVIHRTGDPASLARAIVAAAAMPRIPLPDDSTLVDRVVACYHSLIGRGHE